MNDDCGNEIKSGDRVKVTALHSGRGAFLGITQGLGTVIGFGRTRVELQFGYRVGVDKVGAEFLRVVEPVDGRKLRTPNDAWDDRVGCVIAERVEVHAPAAFYDDHVERDLPGGVVVRRTSRSVIVGLTVEELAELRSDAVHYSTAAEWGGRELLGLQTSARATVRRIDAATASGDFEAAS